MRYGFTVTGPWPWVCVVNSRDQDMGGDSRFVVPLTKNNTPDPPNGDTAAEGCPFEGGSQYCHTQIEPQCGAIGFTAGCAAYSVRFRLCEGFQWPPVLNTLDCQPTYEYDCTIRPPSEGCPQQSAWCDTPLCVTPACPVASEGCPKQSEGCPPPPSDRCPPSQGCPETDGCGRRAPWNPGCTVIVESEGCPQISDGCPVQTPPIPTPPVVASDACPVASDYCGFPFGGCFLFSNVLDSLFVFPCLIGVGTAIGICPGGGQEGGGTDVPVGPDTGAGTLEGGELPPIEEPPEAPPPEDPPPEEPGGDAPPAPAPGGDGSVGTGAGGGRADVLSQPGVGGMRAVPLAQIFPIDVVLEAARPARSVEAPLGPPTTNASDSLLRPASGPGLGSPQEPAEREPHARGDVTEQR